LYGRGSIKRLEISRGLGLGLGLLGLLGLVISIDLGSSRPRLRPIGLIGLGLLALGLALLGLVDLGLLGSSH